MRQVDILYEEDGMEMTIGLDESLESRYAPEAQTDEPAVNPSKA